MTEAWSSAPVNGWLKKFLDEGDDICRGCCFDKGGLLRLEATE
jgi:hypothetical protein